MPGPSSATSSRTMAPSRRALISIRLPGGVYFTALSARFTSTCAMSWGSILAISISPCTESLTACSPLCRLRWRSASWATSSTSSASSESCTLPFSMRVTASTFSTSRISHMESSYMSAYSRCFFSSFRPGAPRIRMFALPEIPVSGVRRSCEMARRRFARSCSCRAWASISLRAAAACLCSSASANSFSMASSKFRSYTSSASPALSATPTTANTLAWLRTARYRHFAPGSVSVVAPACLLFLYTHAATACSSAAV